MKRLSHTLAAATLALMSLAALVPDAAHADVAPGDVIDKSNWQKIEGLVPDFIALWVKEGDLSMKIAELTFDPSELWPADVKEHWESNQGRYVVDEVNGLRDAKTNEPVRGIQGIPFPVIDASDPTAPVQLMWNDV